MTVASPIRPTAPSLGLRSQKSSHRLNQIEKIRANGIGDIVDLPQLVVCGDQSAGKSSVLEGITGIPFPRQEGLCTRFPTEIILRKSAEPLKATATIQPHSSRSAFVSQILRGYRREMEADLSDLPVAIEEVSKLMGIRGFTDSENDPAFASDALRVEVTGPSGVQLSVVDLPGLISVANEEQSEADVDTVHSMVRSYLSSSRTIILAVVQASNDVANQGIIKIAREYDRDGQRTVGIITKPDLINAGAEGKLAKVAQNRDSIKLKLGFFLLKNPSPAEVKTAGGKTRSELETIFFCSPAWKEQNLDMSRVGVENLRSFLQALLDGHLDRELPKVRDEIRRVLETTEEELKAMGPERRSLSDIRSYMTNISMRCYQLAQAALDGNYHHGDADFFGRGSGNRTGQRLRAHVHQHNSDFAQAIRERGHKREVVEGDKTHSVADADQSDSEMPDQADGPILVTKEEMFSWVLQTYRDTRGRELPGNYNHILLAELFHEQSSRWCSLAECHLDAVADRVSKWLYQAISGLLREERLQSDVNSLCQERLEKARNNAHEELKKILADEERHPITYNHYYTDNFQKARNDCQRSDVRDALKKTARQRKSEANGAGVALNFKSVDNFVNFLQPRICVEMDWQACEEALAGLNAYYKVAMKTFVDNVCRQVIERHILTPLPEIFNPTTISELSDEELLRLGSEPEAEMARRQKLNDKAKCLRGGLVDLQCHSG